MFEFFSGEEFFGNTLRHTFNTSKNNGGLTLEHCGTIVSYSNSSLDGKRLFHPRFFFQKCVFFLYVQLSLLLLRDIVEFVAEF